MASIAPELPADSQALHDLMEAQKEKTSPTFFHLRAQLPKQGRTNLPIATSDRMYVWLKTYASGGENELHAHPNEDHVFVVLQGAAEFYGPKGEIQRVAKHDGVFLPRGAFYWFKTVSEEPLVMLRVGAVVDANEDIMGRVNIKGEAMAGDSPENKEVPLILHQDKWFE
jgi:mannose-6-phosphate isomerase-like protein (cupin superfamily)